MIAKYSIDLSDTELMLRGQLAQIVSTINLILNIALNWETDSRKLLETSLLIIESQQRLVPLLNDLKSSLNDTIPAHKSFLDEIKKLFKEVLPKPKTVKRLRLERNDENQGIYGRFFSKIKKVNFVSIPFKDTNSDIPSSLDKAKS